MEDFLGNPLADEDKAKVVKGVSFKVVDKDTERADGDVDVDVAESDVDVDVEKSLVQRLARATARQPKKALLVSFGITVVLSALGPIIGGGLKLTTDTKGWRSRGTFIANREMQAEVLNLNRYQLSRDTDGSHWKSLTETVTEGYFEFSDRGIAYADPDLTSSTSTSRERRLDSSKPKAKADAVTHAHAEAEADFSIDLSEGTSNSRRSRSLTTFEETCDASWYSDANSVLFLDNLNAIWKVQPDKGDGDDANISSSALDKNVLSQICKAELNTMKVLKENDLCTKCTDADGSCQPPHSLVFLLRQKMDSHEKSCDELMDLYTTTVQQEFTDELLDCMEEYSEKFDSATYTPGDLEVCTSFDYLPNVVDSNFGMDGNRNIRYTSSYFPTKTFAGETPDVFKNTIIEIYDSFDQVDDETVRGVYNLYSYRITELTAEIKSNADIVIAMASLGLTIVALLIHNRSPWLAFMGFLQIVLAVPLSYFGYTVLAQLEFFPLLNLVGLFVASAIGADDIFVAVDKWNNTRAASPKDATTEDIAEVALPDAAGAMLLTTITTSVAFFASCVCPITPILCFATYCGLLVLFNYILNILLIFPSMCLWDTWKRNGSTSLFVELKLKKKKTTEKADDETIESSDDESPTKVETKHRILLLLFNQIDRFRWPLLVACLATVGVCLFYALQFPVPKSMDVRLLQSSHPLELHNSWKSNLSSVDLWRPVAVVYVLFGLLPGDTGSRNNPDSLSKLLLDDTFNPSAEEAQLYLRDFCDGLFAQDFALPLETCAINQFETWLEEQSSSATPSSAYSDNCDAAAALPVPVGAFDPCIIAWSKETSSISVLHENGKVRILMITGAVDLSPLSPLVEIDAGWNKFEDYTKEQKALAPESVNKFFHASFMWWYWDGSARMTSTAIGAGLISLAFASIIVIFSSRSITLTIVSFATISFILAASSATLVGLGWELGYLECICFSILIGISCDFVIHFGHAYKHFEGNVDRRLRARFAVVDMGPSILAAAATTVAAACVMLFCSTPFFTKFATILLVTMLYSTIGSFIFYVVLVDLFGPAEPTKLFDLCWNRITGKKKDEETEESNSPVSASTRTQMGRSSVKRTYGFDEIALVAEMDKNGNQRVTRASLALSVKNTYDLDENLGASIRKSMISKRQSGRMSVKKGKDEDGVHWS